MGASELCGPSFVRLAAPGIPFGGSDILRVANLIVVEYTLVIPQSETFRFSYALAVTRSDTYWQLTISDFKW